MSHPASPLAALIRVAMGTVLLVQLSAVDLLIIPPPRPAVIKEQPNNPWWAGDPGRPLPHDDVGDGEGGDDYWDDDNPISKPPVDDIGEEEDQEWPPPPGFDPRHPYQNPPKDEVGDEGDSVIPQPPVPPRDSFWQWWIKWLLTSISPCAA